MRPDGRAEQAPFGNRSDNLLVGRTPELASIRATLDGVARGTGGLVLLSGEPGIGKTRLAREALAQALRAGFDTLVGHCLEQYRAIPFFGLTEALSERLAMAQPSDEGTPSGMWPHLAWLTLQQDSPVGVAGRSPLTIFRAVTAGLRGLAAERPVVLLLEDLHWADSGTISALVYLLGHLRDTRLLVLGTYRDAEVGPQHPLQALLGEVARNHLVEHLALDGLSLARTADLVRARLGIQPVTDDLLELIHRRTGGNPLFAQEMLKALVEQGMLDPRTGTWTASVVREMKLPRSVRSIVAQRVRRLPTAVRELVELASVIGAEFELRDLATVSGRSESDLVNDLDVAVGARLLDEPRTGVKWRLSFSHALLQQAIYEDLSSHRRWQLHLAVAEALERSLGNRAEAWVDLSRHLIGAGERERAIAYLVRAADHAAALYAHAEAARHYTTALELAEERADGSTTAALRRKLGSELGDLNHPVEAIAAYEAALAYYEAQHDVIEQARLHRELAWIHQHRYNFEAALPHLEVALRMWAEERQDAEFARLLLDAARTYAYLTEFAAAGQLVERGLGVARQLGDEAQEARGLLELASLQINQGVPARRLLATFARAEALARRTGDRRTLSRLNAARAAGRLTVARTEYQREVEAANRAGLPDRVAFAASMVATTCMELGEWAEGRTAGRAARAADPHPLWEFVLPWLEGKFVESLKAAEATLWAARARRDRQAEVRCLTQLADWNLQLERGAAALTAAREAFDLVLSRGQLAWVAAACGPLAESAVREKVEDAPGYSGGRGAACPSARTTLRFATAVPRARPPAGTTR